jgi:hypothetical protein
MGRISIQRTLYNDSMSTPEKRIKSGEKLPLRKMILEDNETEINKDMVVTRVTLMAITLRNLHTGGPKLWSR